MTGVDWNGNGKYDPVDVGIDMAIQESEQEDAEKENKPKRGGGCMTAVFMMLFSIPLVVIRMILHGGLNG